MPIEQSGHEEAVKQLEYVQKCMQTYHDELIRVYGDAAFGEELSLSKNAKSAKDAALRESAQAVLEAGKDLGIDMSEW